MMRRETATSRQRQTAQEVANISSWLQSAERLTRQGYRAAQFNSESRRVVAELANVEKILMTIQKAFLGGSGVIVDRLSKALDKLLEIESQVENQSVLDRVRNAAQLVLFVKEGKHD